MIRISEAGMPIASRCVETWHRCSTAARVTRVEEETIFRAVSCRSESVPDSSAPTPWSVATLVATSGSSRSACGDGGASPWRRNTAETLGRSLGSTPEADHAAAARRLWPSTTRGTIPRSTSASTAHLIVSASNTAASTASRGAIMSKSAWTCSRGSPPTSPAGFFAPSPSPSPLARAARLSPPPLNVTPTLDARSDVACSAVTCRTSDDRKSRRSVTSAPDLERSTCASRFDSPSTTSFAPALSASRSDSNVSDAQVTARQESGDAPCRRKA
mmetsp:Transcript_10296/g.34055  ORF Transcript_10296/g.34055 Transcript_10296/m.34055 type:complete len:273 (+) Transcript_10296:679-1497(+)